MQQTQSQTKDKSELVATVDSNDELIRLVTSNADVTSQYVIFRNGYDELYAINVAKVEELIVNKDLNIAKSSDGYSALVGVAKIRDNMCSIVHFDRWLGKGEADTLYELIIVCNFGHQRVGIVIKNVIGIMNIEADKLTDNSNRDPKTSQITEIYVGGKNRLCLVFDSDALLDEIFPEAAQREYDKIEHIDENFTIQKKILFADDSKIVQKAVIRVFDRIGIDYEVFDDAQSLLDRLYTLSPDSIALILSDIEMPRKDGLSLLREIKNNEQYKDIPVILNTNMANHSIIDQAKRFGADYVIHKLDVNEIGSQIDKFARR